MKFEEMQQAWHAAKSKPRSHEELKKMMYAPSGWRFKNITWRELLIFLRTLFFFCLVVYLFDGLKTWPGWILTAYWAYVFLDEMAGLRYLEILPQKDTLKKSMTAALARIRRGALISKIVHGIIWLLVVFLLGAIQAGSMNTLSWALTLSPVLLGVSWWSGRKWSEKIKELKETLEIFGEDPKMPFGPAV